MAAIGVNLITAIEDKNPAKDTFYTISLTASDRIEVKVFNLPAYTLEGSPITHYLRFRVRLESDDNDITYEETITISGEHAYDLEIENLIEGENYVINVGNAQNSTGYNTYWWGATYFIATEPPNWPSIVSAVPDGRDVTFKWKNRLSDDAYYLITTNNYIKDYGEVSSSTTTRTNYLSYDRYGTDYEVFIITVAKNDGTAEWNSTDFTTDPPLPPELHYEMDDLYVDFEIYNPNGVEANYKIYLNNGLAEEGTIGAEDSIFTWWNFAEHDTTYTVKVVFDIENYGEISETMTITTPPGPIRLEQPWTNVIDINGGQVELYIWNQNDVSVTYIVKIEVGEEEYITKTTGSLEADESKSVYINMDRLETEYTCLIVFTKTGYLDSLPSEEIFTTGVLEEWSWTADELDAFNYQGAFNTLTADRMNTFIGHVNTTGNAMQTFGWGTETFSITHFANKGFPLYATDFHFLLTKIKLICSTVASKKGVTINYTVPDNTTQIVKGKEIYGSYFIDATNALNKAISYMK